MKIRLEMEVDLQTGIYDVRFNNVSHPGQDIDLVKLTKVVGRVLENVSFKATETAQPAPYLKLNVN